MRVLTNDVSELVERLGRASTPKVPQANNGITLGELIGGEAIAKTENSILLVGSRALYKLMRSKGFNVLWAIPGAARDQSMTRAVETMVIECKAFDEGVWKGADSGAKHDAASEVFEAGRQVRARGGIVFFIPSASRTVQPDEAYIASTATVNLLCVPPEDLEEGASQSQLWKFLMDYATPETGEEHATKQ